MITDDLAARVFWSAAAEPNDEAARAIIWELGPIEAMHLALTGSEDDLQRTIHRGIQNHEPVVIGAGHRTSQQRASLQLPSDYAAQMRQRWQLRLDGRTAEEILADADRAGIRFITPNSEEWPDQLVDLQVSQPVGLWARGEGHLSRLASRGRAVAVVGARAATAYGEEIASDLAMGLAAAGVPVISGGAYGIDAAAHRGALSAPTPATVAVLAGGLDRLYPRGNAQLLYAVMRHGLLVSEAPPGVTPTRWRFLERNRLIAALSQVSVVVEAGARSGALSTIRAAAALSRGICAVPGPVTSPASAGSHHVIRSLGGVLVTDAADVLDELRGTDRTNVYAPQADSLDFLSARDRTILEAVPPLSWISVTGLITEVQLPEVEIRASLARMRDLGLLRVTGDRVRHSSTKPSAAAG